MLLVQQSSTAKSLKKKKKLIQPVLSKENQEAPS
jgi:hypothetical protein